METIKALVTRNVNCGNLTLNEFSDMMSADLIQAVKIYDEYWKPIYKDRHKKWLENYQKSVLKVATQFAEKKWKTEKKRKEYIDKKLAEIEDKGYYYPNLTFFDMNLNPGCNGISDDCILTTDNPKLERCFNKIKDNKYFKNATGWVLEDNHGFRPQIRLILPEDIQEEFDKKRKTLEDAICNFYKNVTYCGD